MYVLMKVNVDHDDEMVVSMQAASESLDELRQMMEDEYDEEMKNPSVKWLDRGWDPEYSTLDDFFACCQIETCDWSVHWRIMDTNNLSCFSFI